MIILDENIPESQRAQLQRSRVRVRQIGVDVGRKGRQDDEIIPLPLRIKFSTFFTLDDDLFERTYCHSRYCLVFLHIDNLQVAGFVRRVLRQPTLNTRAKRMGAVIRASDTGLALWRSHDQHEARLD